MISEISISNFKSIKKIEGLKLKPLTIFAGVNSSGKSNIMETISFFGQASRLKAEGKSSDLNAIFRYGDIKKYPPEIKDFIIYRKDKNARVTLEINLKSDERLTEAIEGHVQQIGRKIDTVGYSFSFRLADSFFSQKVLINGNPFVEVQRSRRKGAYVVIPKEVEDFRLQVSLDTVLAEEVFSSSSSSEFFNNLSEVARQIVTYIKNNAERIYFLSGERGRIDPEIVVTQPRRPSKEFVPTWIGPNGQYLIELLSECFTREPEKAERVQKWAGKFQLPNIRAGYIVKRKLESNFRDDIANISLNSTLAGLGSRQILSIITQIFWSESGDTILIEEPEISLHPKNQVLLHELFSEAISQGKQIICSTHSPFFVLALSKIVKKKLLKPDQIAVYEVEKDDRGTSVKTLELNKHGFIVSGIPSFMKVEEDLFRDWSESLEEEK